MRTTGDRGDHLQHVATPEAWAAALQLGEYRISTRGRTLDDEGFIHCSRAHQVARIAALFYADLPELRLLQIDPARLDAPVVDEPPAEGGDELFPHVYGPIPVHAVVRVQRWRPVNGTYRLDAGLDPLT